ncbi:hypothetical protein ACFLVZ_02740 [Chloroflexota bacterium]
MIAELRDMKEKLALHTDCIEIERRLKRLNSCIYWVPYYDSHNNKIVGVDLFFKKSAKNMLLKLSNTHQLPLC